MKFSPIAVISLMSAFSLFMGTAVAQESEAEPSSKNLVVEPSPEDLIREYDQNDDQALSVQEFETLYQERIEIESPQEGETEQDQPSRALFSDLDLDMDLQLSPGELGLVTALVSQKTAQ